MGSQGFGEPLQGPCLHWAVLHFRKPSHSPSWTLTAGCSSCVFLPCKRWMTFCSPSPHSVFSFLHGRAATSSPTTPIIPVALTPQTHLLCPPDAVGAISLRSAPQFAPLPHCYWRALPLLVWSMFNYSCLDIDTRDPAVATAAEPLQVVQSWWDKWKLWFSNGDLLLLLLFLFHGGI